MNRSNREVEASSKEARHGMSMIAVGTSAHSGAALKPIFVLPVLRIHNATSIHINDFKAMLFRLLTSCSRQQSEQS